MECGVFGVWDGRKGRECDGLDLRLQKFAHDLPSGGGLGGLQKTFGHATRNQFGFRVDQEIFLFDTDFVIVGHGPPRLLPAFTFG